MNASAARERCHWSPLMRIRQRAKLSATITQTPRISLAGASGHSPKINTIPTSASTMPTTISTSRRVTPRPTLAPPEQVREAAEIDRIQQREHVGGPDPAVQLQCRRRCRPATEPRVRFRRLWELSWGANSRLSRGQPPTISTATRVSMLAMASFGPWEQGLYRPIALAPLLRAQPLKRQRLPPGDGPGTRLRICHVRHAREQATHLDGGRQLASLLEGGADRGGLSLGDNEHAGSTGTRTRSGKPVRGTGVSWRSAVRTAFLCLLSEGRRSGGIHSSGTPAEAGQYGQRDEELAH